MNPPLLRCPSAAAESRGQPGAAALRSWTKVRPHVQRSMRDRACLMSSSLQGLERGMEGLRDEPRGARDLRPRSPIMRGSTRGVWTKPASGSATQVVWSPVSSDVVERHVPQPTPRVVHGSLWGCRPLRGRVKRRSLSNSLPQSCSMMLHAAFPAERGVVSTPGLRVHQQAILVNAQRKERKNRPTPRLGCSEVGPCEVGSRKGHCRTIPCKLLCCAVLGR
jgi:hypothetical protein